MPSTTVRRPPAGRTALLRSAVLLVLAVACAAGVQAQARSAARGTGVAAGPSAPRESRPVWTELNPAQQQALAPLAPHWSGLTDLHKRKWIALSRNFSQLPATEQAKMQERMSDWSKLSRAERAQARLNYAETSRLAPDERKARWEAYQALSEEQRSKLAAAVPPRPAGAAPAIRPAPLRLARLPAQEAADRQSGSRIGVSATQVDHNTLLPQHPAGSPDSAIPAAYR
ncbi:MAG: DUF3106 domain-containing protein [Pseudomonadota bacterium]